MFTNTEIDKITHLYCVEKLSTANIATLLSVSKTPILRILREKNVLRKGKSNGLKISLSTQQEDKIKDMYLIGYKSSEEIAKEVGLSKSYIDNFLAKNNFTRTKSEATTLAKTGVKLSEKTKYNMKLAQQKLAKSGKRKQTGGICKTFSINGLKCQGTYEKYYIEKLINDGVNLPKEGRPVITPYGVYYPDFSFEDKLIEIKSDYTYDILIGIKVNRFTKKIDTKQYEKIKWVNENIKPVEILIIDKRNNNIIKK